MKEQYKPIETPLSTRLREFRHKLLPVIVFLGVGLIVASLWRGNIAEPGFIGVVVADSAYVNSPVTGIVDVLNKQEFDLVNEGEPVAVIQVADSTLLQSRIQVVEAQIAFLRSSMEPVTDRQRNLLNLEGLKLERSMLSAELASLSARKEFVRSEYEQAKSLYEDDLISSLELTNLETRYRAMAEEIEAKTEIEKELDESIRLLDSSFAPESELGAVEASIQVQNAMLREILEEMKPVVLRAPITGVVSQVYKRSGEVVTSGDQLVKIESPEATHLVGYLRQPLTLRPEEGMKVEIRTRSQQREFFESEIIAVGGHITPIEPALQRPGAIYERGLPVKIALAENEQFAFLPGETVDLVLRRN